MNFILRKWPNCHMAKSCCGICFFQDLIWLLKIPDFQVIQLCSSFLSFFNVELSNLQPLDIAKVKHTTIRTLSFIVWERQPLNTLTSRTIRPISLNTAKVKSRYKSCQHKISLLNILLIKWFYSSFYKRNDHSMYKPLELSNL